MEILDLSCNRLSGEIPEFLTRMPSLTELWLPNNQHSEVVPNFGPHIAVATWPGNNDLIYPEEAGDYYSEDAESPNLKQSMIPSTDVSKSNTIKCQWIIDDNIHKSNLNFSRAMEAICAPANAMFQNQFYTCNKISMPRGINYCFKKLYWSSRAFTLLNPENFSQELKLPDHLSSYSEVFMTPLAYALTSYCAFFVYECPEFGTLFDLLHGRAEKVLAWENRYRIAVRIATSLAFLHGFYSASAPIVLLDLSTRSIFMKFMSEPLIGDFELSKIISPSQSMGALSVIAGSVGYIPPGKVKKYAYTMRVTTLSNIYSFGVILLELLTGKEAIHEGLELAKWDVDKSNEYGFIEEFLDHRVSKASAMAYQQMMSIFKIALRCVSASPEERPNARELQPLILDVAQ